MFEVKNEVIVHMVLRNQVSLPDPEGIRHNVLKIKGIIVLGFTETGDPDEVFHAEHPEIFVEVVKIPLKGPEVEIGPGIV